MEISRPRPRLAAAARTCFFDWTLLGETERGGASGPDRRAAGPRDLLRGPEAEVGTRGVTIMNYHETSMKMNCFVRLTLMTALREHLS